MLRLMNGRQFARVFSALQLAWSWRFVQWSNSAGTRCDSMARARSLKRVGIPARRFIRPSRVAALCAASMIFIGACSPPSPNQPPNFVEAIGRTSPAIVAIGDEQGLHGSGFRLANSRLIVTAAHVVKPLHSKPVITWNEKQWPARIIRVDAEMDLALLELETDAPMPGLTLSMRAVPPRAGEWIIVLGCPFGARATATVGIVSAEPGAVLEPAALRTLLQLNAAVNPGNSGGPVMNLEGQVIGVANATIPGGYGLGFAIPVSELSNFLAEKDRGP